MVDVMQTVRNEAESNIKILELAKNTWAGNTMFRLLVLQTLLLQVSLRCSIKRVRAYPMEFINVRLLQAQQMIISLI